MAEKTAIAWCDSTFNPWIGCTEVNPECDNCYARELDAYRLSKVLGGATKEHPISHWGPGAPRYRTSEANWALPIKWNGKAAKAGKPWRVFSASLGDIFDNEIPQDWRRDFWSVIARTPNLSWLLVTKRIGNVSRMVPERWLTEGFPAHVRLLISAGTQAIADRDIPKLLALPCKNGISYEPALGPIDWTRISLGKSPMQVGAAEFRETEFTINGLKGANSLGWPGIQWVIIGGESTQGSGKARPFDLAWARSTVAQCKAAGVPVFMKQIGSAENCVHRHSQHHYEATTQFPRRACLNCGSGEGEHELCSFVVRHRAGADPAEWPSDLRCQEFPT